MKTRDIRNLLNRAHAALETPADLTEQDKQALIEDLSVATREPEPEQPSDEHRYRNYYEHCDTQWDDTWSCMCNDRCPVCNKEIEPYKSEDLEVAEKVAGGGNQAPSAVTPQQPLQYFAVLEAAVRNQNFKPGEHGHYRKVERDDPNATEYYIRMFIEHGTCTFPVGSDKSFAAGLVEKFNSAYHFGRVHQSQLTKNPRIQEVLVGRMGHTNRNEEQMP